ncbi:MAG: cob(I)yrinic acid a,c-diamide adenosyltransferase [bacterium]|nr:cob(I)yrinic acid a,c-diamide adenosyltransferase [bacterium]
MRFYSGKGDGGTTTLFGSGKRLPKTDKVFEALGALDELNSYLGICVSLAHDKNIKNTLKEVQENLFILQAELGDAKVKPIGRKKLEILEKTTDNFGDAVGVITKFTLSGGSPLSAHLDYARTLARRAERKVLEARFPTFGNPEWNLAYLNRLSSLLFVLARYVNKKSRIKEKNPKYK